MVEKLKINGGKVEHLTVEHSNRDGGKVEQWKI